jgi:hypothetical protein
VPSLAYVPCLKLVFLLLLGSLLLPGSLLFTTSLLLLGCHKLASDCMAYGFGFEIANIRTETFICCNMYFYASNLIFVFESVQIF